MKWLLILCICFSSCRASQDVTLQTKINKAHYKKEKKDNIKVYVFAVIAGYFLGVHLMHDDRIIK